LFDFLSFRKFSSGGRKYELRAVTRGVLQAVETNVNIVVDVIELSERDFRVELPSAACSHLESFSGGENRFVIYVKPDRHCAYFSIEVRAFLRAVTSTGTLIFEVKSRGDRKKLKRLKDFLMKEVLSRQSGSEEPGGEGEAGKDTQHDRGQDFYGLPQVLVCDLLSHYTQRLKDEVFQKKVRFSIFLFMTIFFVLSGILFNLVSQFLVEYRIRQLVSGYEKAHNVKVFYFIHRKRSLSIFGISLYEYLEVYDAHRFLRDLKSVPEDKNLVIIIHSPGGELLAAMQIAKVLKEWRGKVSVVVPYYAMSAGTLIALSADIIYADRSVTFGAIDPQIPVGGNRYVSAADLYRVCGGNSTVSVQERITCEMGRKAMKQVESFLKRVVLKDKDEKVAEAVINTLLYTERSHDFPFFAENLKEMGLNVIFEIPRELRELSDLLINIHRGR